MLAQAWHGTVHLPPKDARSAIIATAGVNPAEFTMHPFYPENFLIICGSQAVRDRVLAAQPLPLGATSLVLRPWMHLAHAEMSALLFQVSIELEGILVHAWKEGSAASQSAAIGDAS